MTVARVLAAALHRLGVVRQLQTLWRGDLQTSETRSAARVQKTADDGRALQRQVQTQAEAQRKHWAELKDARVTIEQLTRQLDALAGASKQLERRAHGLEQVIARNRIEAARLRGFQRVIESGTLAGHVTDAIAGAPLVEDPAPMLTIDRLFPDDVYDTFIAALPPADAFTVKDRTKSDYRVRRPAVAVSDLTEAVWSYLDGDLIPLTMVPAIAKRFAPFVSAHYRDLFGPELGAGVAELPLGPTDARLMLRRPGYHLDPHLDPKRVLLTMLMYFARPGDSEAHGTAFYRVDGRIVRDHATTYYPQRYGHRCELVRVAPFRPNTAVIFLNTAAHGADFPATASGNDERYALQFYVGPPVSALKALVSGLPDAQRRTWAELLD